MDCLGPQPTLLGNGSTEGVPLFIVLLITLALAHLLPPTAISFTGFNLGPKLRIPNPPAKLPMLKKSATTGFIPVVLESISAQSLYLSLLATLVILLTASLPAYPPATDNGPNIAPANNVLT